jgi:RNA polymerase sigma factor (sigma-70 family)
LRRWAHRRLPRWARQRADTSDIAQQSLLETLKRLDSFEPRRQEALQSYLRKTILNRIRDEMRWAARRRPTVSIDSCDLTAPDAVFDQAVGDENKVRYRVALERLEPADRELIVASLELGYSYEQVAVATGRKSPDAARVAIRRALLRLAAEMDSG